MRVVWVVPGIFIAGGVRIIVEYANRLAARGHEVEILTMKQVPDDPCFPIQVPLQTYSPRAAKGADALVATSWPTVEPAMKAEAVARKYYFIQNRESYFRRRPWQQWAVERYYSLPLIPITISHWLADVLRIHGKESFVIHNGLDTNLMREIRGLRGAGYRILIEGGPYPLSKRTGLALAAAKRVSDAEVWMLTTGKGTDEVDKCFCCLTGDRVPEVYSSCDVMIKMSDFEGYPGPQAEAMACGCAVVTSDVPGTNEYCTDGVNCLAVPTHDVDAGTEVLEKLRDPVFRGKLVQGGLDTIGTRFGWEDKVTALEAVLSGEVRPSDLPCPYHSAEELEQIKLRSHPYSLPLFESLKEMGRFAPRRGSPAMNHVLCALTRLAKTRRLRRAIGPGAGSAEA